MSETRRKKIYLGSADAGEKASDAALLRKLVLAVFEKAMICQKDGLPIPDSYRDLFGVEAPITAAVRGGDPDAMRYGSEGGAIHAREQLLLRVLSGKTETPIPSTDTLKESLLANLYCIGAIENPVELKKQRANNGDGE